jgi:TonB-dependent receptor
LQRTDAWLFLKPKYYDVYPRRGQALLRSNPELFEPDVNATLNNSNLADYDAEEATTAAYAMGTYRFGAHTIIGGIRFERNEWESLRKAVNLTTRAVTARNVGASYDFVLPGLHLRHELRKNLILRESFNQSYGRPSLSQLTRGRTVAVNGNITDGNSDLQPAFSNNFDVQLEYYTANSGLYSVGVFFKDVEDFSYSLVGRFDVLDANGDPVLDPAGAFTYTVPANGSTGKNKGIELIARQRLTFLPELLRGFTASASATFTDSEATIPNRTDRDDLTLPGFSRYLFTAALEYARGPIHMRADYRYRDDYIEGLGSNIDSDEYFSAEERVDFEVSYAIRRGLGIFASATNLTNRPQVSYQGYRPFVEDTAFAGRKITIGMEYKF